MNVLCITELFPGIQSFLAGKGEPEGMPGFYHLLRVAEAEGHRLHVVLRTNRPLVRQLSERVLLYSANLPERWRRKFRGKFVLDVLAAVRLGCKLYRKVKFDVIYGQQSYGAVVGFLLHLLLGLPNLTRCYGSLLFGGHGASRWRMLRGNLKAVLPFVVPCRYLIVTQDGTQAEQVARLFGVKGERLRVWLNGVDRNLLEREEDDLVEWPVPTGANSLLWVGRLSGWKRPERAVEALHGLVARRRDTHLVFVGEGEAASALAKRAEQLGLTRYVHFSGPVSHRQVPAYCRRCSVFLSLHDYSNLANTVIEAMACGCCVVALNEGDTNLLIRDGETGFLVDKARLGSLPELLNRLLDSPDLRAAVGARARQFVLSQFPSWDERIAMEIALLESVVGKRQPNVLRGAVVDCSMREVNDGRTRCC